MVRSSFFEFSIATSALFTAQTNMQITSHNIANANNRGFSRQYGVTTANTPLAGYGAGMYGTGSSVTEINRHRDEYLDTKYWDVNSVNGEYNVKSAKMQNIERLMNELNDVGITTSVNDMFDSLQDLSTNPGDMTFRNNFISNIEKLTEHMGELSANLKKEQSEINQEVKAVVENINSLGRQIATLNKQISLAEQNGNNANDLRDQRTVLIDELSQYVNVNVEEVETDLGGGNIKKDLKIQINGYDFIKGNDINELKVQERHVKVVDEVNQIASTIKRINDGTHPTMTPADIPALQSRLQEIGEFDFSGGNIVFLGDPGNPKDNVTLYDSATGDTTKLNSSPVPFINKDSYRLNPNDIEGLYDVYIGGTDQQFDLYSPTLEGELKGLIDVRDGNNGKNHAYTDGENVFGETFQDTTDFKGVPHYMDKLNNLARTIAMSFNEGLNHNGESMDGVTGHVNGFDLNGSNGHLLFTYKDDYSGSIQNDITTGVYDGTLSNGTQTYIDYSKLNAENFTINTDMLKDPSLLGLSGSPTAGESDNTVAMSLLRIKKDDGLFAEGRLSDYITGMTSEVAVTTAQAVNFEATYTDRVMMTENQRLSVSGVDLNEEMSNLVRYQQMYQAAATLINTVDSVYDTCINRLGTGF